MRYGDAAAFRQALEQRLRRRAQPETAHVSHVTASVSHSTGSSLVSIETAPERWLLKGGFALDLRLSDRARATRDVDIDWQAAEEELLEALIEAAALTTDDFFTFAIERTGMPPERLGGAHRFRVNGQPRRTAVRDVPARRRTPVRSQSASTTRSRHLTSSPSPSIEPVEVPAVPLERHIAEKLHAYTRRYGDDQPSSRAKDLIDIVLISELKSFEFERLREVIVRVFEARATHDVPSSLPAPPGEWASPIARWLTRSDSIPTSSVGHRLAASFIDPVLAAGHGLTRWDPNALEWLRA